MRYWYVLFVRTGREQNVLEFLRDNIDTELVCPFLPMSTTLFKKLGLVKKEVKPLFPSYVFIESDLKAYDFLREINSVIKQSHDVIRTLKYDGSNEMALRYEEAEFISKLLDEANCIGASSGIIENDKIYIKNGPLVGRESIIKRIDRHKRQAVIELDFMGRLIQTTVALEIVEKIDNFALC